MLHYVFTFHCVTHYYVISFHFKTPRVSLFCIFCFFHYATLNVSCCTTCLCFILPYDVYVCHCVAPHTSTSCTYALITVKLNTEILFCCKVCEGDTVVVYLKNHLEDGSAITLHWHGIHQKGTQFMDGVPMLTQCAVLQFNTFRLKLYNYVGFEGTE